MFSGYVCRSAVNGAMYSLNGNPKHIHKKETYRCFGLLNVLLSSDLSGRNSNLQLKISAQNHVSNLSAL
jgi:hypothetical protein